MGGALRRDTFAWVSGRAELNHVLLGHSEFADFLLAECKIGRMNWTCNTPIDICNMADHAVPDMHGGVP
jgi:hypothetical protein